MKHLNKLLIFLLISCIVSCSDDSASNEDKPASIIGTWNIDEMHYFGNSSDGTTDSEFTGIGKEIAYTIIFSENPKEINSGGSYIIERTTTTNGQTTVYDDVKNSSATITPWNQEGDQLSAFPINGGRPTTIVTLNETTLELNTIQETYIQEGDYEYTGNINWTIKCSRQ